MLCRVLYTLWHWKKFKCILVSGPGWLSRYRDLLRARRSSDRIPVGARFSARVHNCPEAHPDYYTMNTGTSAAVKRPGSGVDYPSLSTSKIKGRVELYIYNPSETSWPVQGLIYLYHFNNINVRRYTIVKQLHDTVKHASSLLQKQAI